MASYSAIVIMISYYQELTRTPGKPSKRMMHVGFRIIIEEPFYVLFEARGYLVTAGRAFVYSEAVTNGNGRPLGVRDSRGMHCKSTARAKEKFPGVVLVKLV